MNSRVSSVLELLDPLHPSAIGWKWCLLEDSFQGQAKRLTLSVNELHSEAAKLHVRVFEGLGETAAQRSGGWMAHWTVETSCIVTSNIWASPAHQFSITALFTCPELYSCSFLFFRMQKWVGWIKRPCWPFSFWYLCNWLCRCSKTLLNLKYHAAWLNAATPMPFSCCAKPCVQSL